MTSGITLGLTDEEFTALFVAIVFHQFFEGIGIGNVLADLQHEEQKKVVVYFFTFLYGVTTPAGVAIGIVIQWSNYDVIAQYVITHST